MGEIKSTLDLVMERTRHLTLSDEEKKKQRTADFAKRLQGLLQQYADGVLRLEDLRERVAGLQAEVQIEDRQGVVDGVIERIAPDGDNAIWLALLAQEAPERCSALQKILEDHRRARADILDAGQQDQLDQLSDAHGISGSAVIPNPEGDPDCRQRLTDLGRGTRARITALRDRTAT